MDPEEAIYRQGLSRNWTLRYGQRPDSLSRLSAIADGALLVAGAVAFALYLVRVAPLYAVSVVIGVAIVAFIASHAMNGHFRKLEKRAFLELEQEATANATKHASHGSPFYPLAKLAMKPRVHAKQAWVEKRTETFLRRRADKQRQADIFEKQSVKLGSIHGTAGSTRVTS